MKRLRLLTAAALSCSIVRAPLYAQTVPSGNYTPMSKEVGPGLKYSNGQILPDFGTTTGKVADGGALAAAQAQAAAANTAANNAASQAATANTAAAAASTSAQQAVTQAQQALTAAAAEPATARAAEGQLASQIATLQSQMATVQSALASGAGSGGGSVTVPSQVTQPMAAAGTNQVVITAAAVTATPAVTGYSIRRGSTSGGEGLTPIATNVPLPYTDTNVVAGQHYYYTVAAVNSAGTGAYSGEVTATPTAPNAAPAQVAGLTVTPGAGRNTINATAVSATPAVTGYTVRRGTASGAESSTPIVVNTSLPYVDTTVTAGVAYFYVVAAVNSVGTGAYSTEASGTPTQPTAAPGQVTGLTLVAGNNNITINATPVSATPAVSGYTVGCGTVSGSEATLATNVALPYVAGSLVSGTTYYCKVAAVNSVGTGPYSAEGSATPTSAFRAQTPSQPSLQYQLDASEPVVTSLTSGTAGIMLDSTNGGVQAAVETGGGITLTHGYGEVSLVFNGGPANSAYFHDSAAGYNNGYDGFEWPLSSNPGAAMFQPAGAAWDMKFVARQTAATGNTSLFQYITGNGKVDINTTGTNGAFYVDQNNTGIYGSEPATGAVPTAWGIWDIKGNGSTFVISRNGTVTYTSNAGSGGGLPTATAMEILNNCGCDVAYMEMFAGNPSIAQDNAETQRLATKYTLSGISTVTAGSTNGIAASGAPAADPGANYLQSPVYPVYDTLPTSITGSASSGSGSSGGSSNFVSIPASNAQAGSWTAGNYAGLDYQVLTPTGYNPSTTTYPVIMFLHGSECGEPNNSNTCQIGFPIDQVASNLAMRAAVPAIWVAPTVPTSPGTWGGNVLGSYPNYSTNAASLIQHIASTMGGDPNHLLLTGWSMGGEGTWWATYNNNPGIFAAFLPVSGEGDPSWSSSLLNTKIWAVHELGDSEVPIGPDEQMFANIHGSGGIMKYTELVQSSGNGDQDHDDAASQVFQSGASQYLTWLVAQHK